MANTFGKIFRVSSFGESHGTAVGVLIDGCPPGYSIDIKKIQQFLDRRKPGQSHLSSPRQESDLVTCLSGLEDGVSLGSPIVLMVENKDVKKTDYDQMKDVFRPSHADLTTLSKFGIKAKSGGGRSSARETIARVAAASIAEQVLRHHLPGFNVIAYVESIKDIEINTPNPWTLNKDTLAQSNLMCPDEVKRKEMEELILKVKDEGDSVGGTIRCLCLNPPVGLGEPVFDKLEADLAKAMMSLPATRGFEVGDGFHATKLLGSEHNDVYEVKNGKIRTRTNHSGGIQGGISNGEIISVKVAFKPVATIFKSQETVDRWGHKVQLKPTVGRHDPCVLPRAVPMVEAMMLIVLMDHFLRQELIKVSLGPEATWK